jgi:hypothetical protein
MTGKINKGYSTALGFVQGVAILAVIIAGVGLISSLNINPSSDADAWAGGTVIAIVIALACTEELKKNK